MGKKDEEEEEEEEAWESAWEAEESGAEWEEIYVPLRRSIEMSP